jgi:hypothetical protein
MAYEFTAANSRSLEAGTSATDEPLTIAAWCYPTTLGVGQSIVSVGINGGFGRCQLQIAPTNVIRLGHFSNANVSAGFTDSTGSCSQNAWNHACGVFVSESSRTAYLDGTAGTTSTTSLGATGPFNSTVIGARYGNTLGFYFSGRIAEVGIWSAALTADEIASLAKGMTCDKVRPQSLVYYAPLVRDLQDVRGGLTITNNNSATVANHPRVYA